MVVENSTDLVLSAGLLTSALFLISLGIFVGLAAKSRSLKSFQSQISIFIGVYIAGELLELSPVQTATGLPPEAGSQLHVLATIIITTVLWARFVHSNRSTKHLVDQYDGTVSD